MGNVDKSLCEALLAIWSCTRPLRRLACLLTRSARGIWFPKFINQHGDPFPEDGGTAEELQKPVSEVYVCLAIVGPMTFAIFLSSLLRPESWATRAFRSPHWEILGGKRNVKNRIR